jgi:hypothetical protein
VFVAFPTTVVALVAAMAIGRQPAGPLWPDCPGTGPLHAPRTWVVLVRDVVDAVPPRLLLGGHGAHSVLDRLVREHGMSRECFEHLAASVVHAVALDPDRSADEALARVLDEFPLPDGVEPFAPPGAPGHHASPEFREARDLVHELVARLRTPEFQGRPR